MNSLLNYALQYDVHAGEHEANVRRLYGQWAAPISEARWYNDEEVLRHLDPIKSLRPRRILELCCGSGIVLKRLAQENPDTRIYGVDISPVMCGMARDRCKELPNVQVYEGDWLDPISRGQAYDIIIVKNSLHLIRHLHEKLQALSNFSHARTQLVVLETVSPSLVSQGFVQGLFDILDQYRVKTHFFTRPSLLSALSKGGWARRPQPKIVDQLISVDKWLSFKATSPEIRKRAFSFVLSARPEVKSEMNLAFNASGLYMLRRQLISFNSRD